jgi:hypothetical protein
MNLTPYFGQGNDKIKKALVWSLPSRTTCPGATDICKAVCYAKATEEFHHNVVPQARERNFKLSKRRDFTALIIDALKRRRLRALRIHESGDFYNQEYLNKWVEIMKARPDFLFWAFTKSYMLDWTEALKLPNLKLRSSVDATSKGSIPGVPLAILSKHTHKGVTDCPGTLVSGHAIKCNVDCRLCMETEDHIRFTPRMQQEVKTVIHVYCDGDTELQKVSAERAPIYADRDIVLDTEEDIRAELEDYGYDEARIEAAIKEWKAADIHETVEV